MELNRKELLAEKLALQEKITALIAEYERKTSFMINFINVERDVHNVLSTVRAAGTCDVLQFKVDVSWEEYQRIFAEKIKRVEIDPTDIKAKFMWSLVKQEIEIFIKLDRFISKENLDFIVERRGFNVQQTRFLVDVLKKIGIYKEIVQIDKVSKDLPIKLDELASVFN